MEEGSQSGAVMTKEDTRFARRTAREMEGLTGIAPKVALADSGNLGLIVRRLQRRVTRRQKLRCAGFCESDQTRTFALPDLKGAVLEGSGTV